ncbi:DNA-3-methyladenine glycosylase [hydrothermal vent metagenome]|uniref:DNA-3-methyladenine glycosylase n=1 Tax=hydrothermal vent metagenome TaxID=652676 RepID=A0A3B0ZEG1_9ZZZZ
MKRCDWANSNELEVKYHDKEWGVPVHNDRLLFELLILEGAQSGLSWATILGKRAGYLRAFDNFDVKKVARYSAKKLEKLVSDPGIVRHKLKINATVENARQFLLVQKEFGSFNKYIWSFVRGVPKLNAWKKMSQVPTSSLESEAMSKDLKKRGFKFVGPTTCYAYMQATGMVNDHLVSCFRYAEVKMKQKG